jgi:type IV pilus assembly protein PilC
MLSSGIVLSEAVEIISEQQKPGFFQEVLYDISIRIQNGESLSGALAAYPKIFDSMFVSIIAASEISGQMPQMLDVLDKYIESENSIVKQIKAALVYPIVMMVLAVVSTATLMFFVLPKFTAIYKSRGQALPAITQLLITVSDLLSNWKSGLTIASVFVAIGAGIYYGIKTEIGKQIVHYIQIRLPVLGTMFIDTIMTRSTKIMATMLTTGVPLLNVLEVVKSCTLNRYFHTFWSQTYSKVESGTQLSEAMKFAPYNELIAPAILQMIRAGEKSGRLGNVCERVSIFYEKKLKASMKAVTALIEPLMIVIMGIIIGVIVIGLLMPILRISSVMSH